MKRLLFNTFAVMILLSSVALYPNPALAEDVGHGCNANSSMTVEYGSIVKGEINHRGDADSYGFHYSGGRISFGVGGTPMKATLYDANCRKLADIIDFRTFDLRVPAGDYYLLVRAEDPRASGVSYSIYLGRGNAEYSEGTSPEETVEDSTQMTDVGHGCNPSNSMYVTFGTSGNRLYGMFHHAGDADSYAFDHGGARLIIRGKSKTALSLKLYDDRCRAVSGMVASGKELTLNQRLPEGLYYVIVRAVDPKAYQENYSLIFGSMTALGSNMYEHPNGSE
jgi:hypothetical protein